MELTKDTRVAYFRDPKNHQRVLTVVSKRDAAGENLSFAFAVNRPTEWKHSHDSKDYMTDIRERGDAFSKRKGLEIALGRLNTKPTTVHLDGRAPKIAILRALENHENSVVKRIVNAELDYLDMVEQLDVIDDSLAKVDRARGHL